jgi:hypothetical protein
MKKLNSEEKSELVSKIKTHTLKTLRREFKLSRNYLFGCLNEALSKGSLNPEEYDSFIAKSIFERKLRLQRPFPVKIEDRLEAILSSVNTEVKQVVLTLLDKNPKTMAHIKALYTYATNNVWEIGNASFTEYCQQTFMPIGAVAEESLTLSDLDITHLGISS